MQKAGCRLAAKGEFMAKLYYYYGAMGSSKTANALMTHFNYEEVGQKALLCKPAIDARDGERTVYSRIGLQHECILLEELQQMKEEEIRGYDCIIVDEVQFATPEQVDFLSDIVDLLPELERRNEGVSWMLELLQRLDKIKSSSKKIGNAQRMLFQYFFRELFNSESDSYLNLQKAVENGYNKYYSQV